MDHQIEQKKKRKKVLDIVEKVLYIVFNESQINQTKRGLKWNETNMQKQWRLNL